jgi:putative sigma-54 modulation protein
MKVQYVFKHLDHSEALQEYCQGRLDEVSRFLLKDYTGHVTFSKRLKEFCVEFTVLTRQKPFRCKSHHYDIYSAVDEAISKLEKQMLKVRKIMTHHKKPTLKKSRRWAQKKDDAA